MHTRLSSRPRALGAGGTVVVGALWALATLAVVPAVRIPAHVDQLTIDNHHPWTVSVAVTGAGRHGWVGLGRTDRDRAQTFDRILDQGDTWVVRFAYGGASAEVRITRAQ